MPYITRTPFGTRIENTGFDDAERTNAQNQWNRYGQDQARGDAYAMNRDNLRMRQWEIQQGGANQVGLYNAQAKMQEALARLGIQREDVRYGRDLDMQKARWGREDTIRDDERKYNEPYRAVELESLGNTSKMSKAQTDLALAQLAEMKAQQDRAKTARDTAAPVVPTTPEEQAMVDSLTMQGQPAGVVATELNKARMESAKSEAENLMQEIPAVLGSIKQTRDASKREWFNPSRWFGDVLDPEYAAEATDKQATAIKKLRDLQSKLTLVYGKDKARSILQDILQQHAPMVTGETESVGGAMLQPELEELRYMYGVGRKP